MRCPRCQSVSPADAKFCRACGHRLFSWLGDPFGSLEVPDDLPAPAASPAPAAAAMAAPAIAGFPWGKAIIAGILIVLLLPVSTLWATVAAVAVGFALWRWRRIGCGLFLLLMVGVVVAVPLLSTLTRG